jgi:hypothetical protein
MGIWPDRELGASGLPRAWEATAPRVAGRSGGAVLRHELGRGAADALLRTATDDLLRLMLSPGFRPAADTAVVTVLACPHCAGGSLRVAGSLRTAAGRRAVRGCDTCGAVEVGGRRVDAGEPSRRAPTR